MARVLSKVSGVSSSLRRNKGSGRAAKKNCLQFAAARNASGKIMSSRSVAPMAIS